MAALIKKLDKYLVVWCGYFALADRRIAGSNIQTKNDIRLFEFMII
jgi:hypothetical protein